MSKTVQRAAIGAALSLLLSAGAYAVGDESHSESQSFSVTSVKEAILAKPADILSIVERNVSANPQSAGEIVKSAIEATKADAAAVADIVRVASKAAPDQMRSIAQYATVAAPDALSNVQGVLSTLDPAAGSGYSAKEAGGYLWAKDVRLGSVIATSDPAHFVVRDINGTQLGDLRAETGATAPVRATVDESSVKWIYFARVPVPTNLGVEWIQEGGGILVLRNPENNNFYLQYEGSEFNPLNFPGQGVVTPGPANTAPGGGLGLIPPGPGPVPPVVTPTPTTPAGFTP